MMPITLKVSNSINRYEKMFGHRIKMGQISRFEDPEEFETYINKLIKTKTPELGESDPKPSYVSKYHFELPEEDKSKKKRKKKKNE